MKILRSIYLFVLFNLFNFVFAQDQIILPQPTEFINSIITNDKYSWETVYTYHSELYYQPGTITEIKIDQLENDVEAGVERALDILGIDSYNSGFRIFFLEDRENQMNEIVNKTVKAMTLFSHNAILMVHNKNVRPYTKHEIFHLLSYLELGIPYSTWLREGSAVFADGYCQEYNLETMGAYLLKSGKLIPLEKLIFNFGDYDDLVTYLQSGSFFQFIYNKYGLEKIKELWNLNRESLNEYEIHKIKGIEKEWKTYLIQLDIETKDINWEKFKILGCG